MILIAFASCLLAIFQATISCPISEDKILDLSHGFDESTLNWPGSNKFKMNIVINKTMEEGFWLQVENFESSIHCGTHVDAPFHFAKEGWSVEQIPLNRLLGPAAVVDITSRTKYDRDALLQTRDLQAWELLTGRSLNKSIVLIRTGWGQKWPNRAQYFGTANNDPNQHHFPGISAGAAQWLVDNRNIYAVGIDTPSLDNGRSSDYMAHRTILGANVYAIENLHNLEKLPSYGAVIHVMPIKIQKASGAPARVLAYLT